MKRLFFILGFLGIISCTKEQFSTYNYHDDYGDSSTPSFSLADNAVSMSDVLNVLCRNRALLFNSGNNKY